MRLYLSSFLFGNQPEKLIKLTGGGGKVAIIANAGDFEDNNKRLMYLEEEANELHKLGFSAEELDLRKYFGEQALLYKQLQKYGLIWVSGGNVFILRQAMKQSGFDHILVKGLEADSFVYAGFSAGGCVLSPDLKPFALTDEPELTRKVYGLEPDYTGLGVLDYYFEPHFESDHPESESTGKEVEKLKSDGLPHKALRDGEVLVIDGDKTEILV